MTDFEADNRHHVVTTALALIILTRLATLESLEGMDWIIAVSMIR
jgi:hypothetical protein